MKELPCTVIFQGGVEVHRIQGLQEADVIIEEITSYMH